MALQKTTPVIYFQTTQIRVLLKFKPFIIMLCAVILSTVSFFNANSVFQVYLYKIVQLLLFVLLGVFYQVFQLKSKAPNSLSLKQKIIPVAIITCAICTALCLVYSIYGNISLIIALSSGAAFAVPFIVNESWILFNKIPEKEYRIWVPEKRIENNASIFLDSLYLKLKLGKKYHDSEDEVYKVYMPYYIKLGEFFSRFINEKNRKLTVIEDVDYLKKLYAWEFFATDNYGVQSRRLDPNKNIVDNKLKQSSVIVAKRVEPIKLLTYQQA